MRIRQMDVDGDMTFGQSQQNFLVNSPACVAQLVETSFNLFLGEWYLDITQGVPYAENVIGYNSQATADQTLISYATNIQGVTGLDNWQSTVDPETRAYESLGATLFTLFGETQLQIDYSGDL